MNDEFLYRLRADPPSRFALRLRTRLDRQAASAAGRRVNIFRLFVVAPLVGASALAVMSPTVRDQASAWMASLRSADEAPVPAALPKKAKPSSADTALDLQASAADESPFGEMGTRGAQRKGGAAKGDVAGTGTPNARGLGSGAASSASAHVAAGRLRNEVTIVGSGAVFPFTRAVADEYRGQFRRPSFQTSGTDIGFEQFCRGVGGREADITQATRAMAAREMEKCAQSGMVEVYQLKVGYYALAVVTSLAAVPMQLTRGNLYRALTRQGPHPSATVANLTRSWQDVDSSLPNLKMEILGPVLSFEAQDALAELILQPGCATQSWHDTVKALGKREYDRICGLVRDDDVYVAMTGDDAAILRRLEANPGAIALVDYRFLVRHRDRLQEIRLDGIRADPATIANGAYPAARALYLYVKGSHLNFVRDLRGFVRAYVEEETIGPRGLLVPLGFIPLTEDERRTLRADPFAVNVMR